VNVTEVERARELVERCAKTDVSEAIRVRRCHRRNPEGQSDCGAEPAQLPVRRNL